MDVRICLHSATYVRVFGGAPRHGFAHVYGTWWEYVTCPDAQKSLLVSQATVNRTASNFSTRVQKWLYGAT
uniref:Uncharacterized protein n=1 Tax=Larimichthys crocea TaxID=215358 RepID=A0A0F8B0G1_LARCR